MCEKCLELQSERDAALAQVLVLREALEAQLDQPETPESYNRMMERIQEALSNTSATAQETVARIEREALEKAWAKLWNTQPLLDSGSPTVPVERIRAAILGEKEKG